MNAKFDTKLEKIFLGLPSRTWAPVATRWQIGSDLRKMNFFVEEVSSFQTLLPELISPTPYLLVIHSDLLDLMNSANCDRAILIKLATLLSKSQFIVWNKNGRWIPSGSLPCNLSVWSGIQTDEVTLKVLELLNGPVHLLGHQVRRESH